MTEYLFPVPGSVLRNLLDCKAQTGEQFRENEATADMMLAMDRGDIKPERYYAKRWKWSASKVHRKKTEVQQRAEGWRNFNHNNTPVEVKQSEAKVKQTEARRGQNGAGKADPEAEVKQTEAEVKQYRTDTYSDTDIKVINNLLKGSKTKNATTFQDTTWQYQFSYRHLRASERLGIATKSALKNEEKTLQAGAAIFDKLHRIDGHSQEEIETVMSWLLKPDNWWIESGAYMSPTKLRKSDSQGVKYFESFKIKAGKANVITSKKTGRATPASNAQEVARIYELSSNALGAGPGHSPGSDGGIGIMGRAANG